MLLFRMLMARRGLTFFLCGLAGWMAATLLPEPWRTPAGMLVTYHLFLGALVYLPDEEASRVFNGLITVLFHLLCVGLVVGLRVTSLVIAQRVRGLYPPAWSALIAYLGAIGFVLNYGGACALTYFERDWLFRGGNRLEAVTTVRRLEQVAPERHLILTSTGAEHEEWLRERALQKDFSRLALSPQDDFAQWLRDRQRAGQRAGLQEATLRD